MNHEPDKIIGELQNIRTDIAYIGGYLQGSCYSGCQVNNKNANSKCYFFPTEENVTKDNPLLTKFEEYLINNIEDINTQNVNSFVDYLIDSDEFCEQLSFFVEHFSKEV